MKTGEYRQFFDNLGIIYPNNINKTTLQKAYTNYWKYSKFGENNIYHRLPLEVKGYISTFIEIRVCGRRLIIYIKVWHNFMMEAFGLQWTL